MGMCEKERYGYQSQFVYSGDYVKYGAGGCGADEHIRGLDASNKLGNNYSHQHVAVMRRAQYGTADALEYSPQLDVERGPQYGTGEDSRQQVAVMRPQYDTEECVYISLVPPARRCDEAHWRGLFPRDESPVEVYILKRNKT